MSTRLLFPALAAVLALSSSGCGPAQGKASSINSTASLNPTSASTTPAAKNLVTPETAGDPVLTLKIGDPLTFQKDGVTIVLTPRSVVKLDGAPADLSDPEQDNTGNCQAWWALTASISADVPANTSWKDWAASINTFSLSAKGTTGDKYDVFGGDAGSPKRDGDGLVQQLWLLVADWGKHKGEHYQKEITGKKYFSGCDVRGGTPTGQVPIAVADSLGDIRSSGPRDVEVAVWQL